MSKATKQILLFTAVAVFLAALECALTPLIAYLQKGESVLLYILYYASNALALIAPFAMLGVAWGAARVRSLGYAMIFFGIYALSDILLQLPLSLFAYYADPIYLYSEILFTYMLTSIVTSLIFLLIFILCFSLFFYKRGEDAEKKIFTWRSPCARAAAIGAGAFTLYRMIGEITEMAEYAKAKLYVLSGEDIFDFIFTVLFILLTGVLSYVTVRLAERLLPTVPREDSVEQEGNG